ncbi:unnamed protein product [Brachionus calyciflorus]|uniref:Uncharacterized protein n=1 Tax=Brachionus calyciflorus TaxID=104777 RepID=A0A814FWG3_9BILA|nr:unnamed protein product [Brachionus calyciflorus]
MIKYTILDEYKQPVSIDPNTGVIRLKSNEIFEELNLTVLANDFPTRCLFLHYYDNANLCYKLFHSYFWLITKVWIVLTFYLYLYIFIQEGLINYFMVYFHEEKIIKINQNQNMTQISELVLLKKSFLYDETSFVYSNRTLTTVTDHCEDLGIEVPVEPYDRTIYAYMIVEFNSKENFFLINRSNKKLEDLRLLNKENLNKKKVHLTLDSGYNFSYLNNLKLRYTDDLVKQEINVERGKFINLIDEIRSKNFNSNIDPKESSNESLFNGIFCFLIPRTYKKNHFYGKVQIGKLVITNEFISPQIIHHLKILCNDDKCITCVRVKIDAEDLVMTNLIMSLIETKQVDDDVIDLSDKNKNILKSFRFKSVIASNLDKVNFHIMDSIVNVDKIEEFILLLHYVYELPDNFFFKFKNIKNLLISTFGLHYEPSYFNGLNNLVKLELYRVQLKAITQDSMASIENIEVLKFIDSNVESIDDGAFKNMKNLRELDLSSNKITQITDLTLQGLDNLTYLNLKNNPIKKVPKSALSRLTKLETFEETIDYGD